MELNPLPLALLPLPLLPLHRAFGCDENPLSASFWLPFSPLLLLGPACGSSLCTLVHRLAPRCAGLKAQGVGGIAGTPLLA